LFLWTSVVANGVPRSAARQRIGSCSVFRAPHPTPERVRHLLNVPPPNKQPHQLGGVCRRCRLSIGCTADCTLPCHSGQPGDRFSTAQLTSDHRPLVRSDRDFTPLRRQCQGDFTPCPTAPHRVPTDRD
jgi:hypothetical protein